jgi:uncharacterized LabA/DUF88 family protein
LNARRRKREVNNTVPVTIDANTRKSAYVFIDGSNLYFDWNSAMSDKRLDVEKYVEKVRELFPEYDIQRVYYHCTAVGSEVQEKFLKRLEYIPYFEVKAGTVKRQTITIDEQSYVHNVDQGTDVDLACGMVMHSCLKHCQAIILCSRDNDFLGAIKLIKNQGTIVETCVLEHTRNMVTELARISDNIRVIPQDQYEQISR